MSPEAVRLTVGGLRGLSTEQSLSLARPNGAPGSGLTILVGSNNAGKSTFIEAMRALSSRRPTSFSEGRRNRNFGDQVSIRLDGTEGYSRALKSIRPGGSETSWTAGEQPALELLVLPSRRAFEAYFGDPGQSLNRSSYALDYQAPPLKTATINQFGGRLFKINRDPESRRGFDDLLRRVVVNLPDWTIDQNDSGQYYLKFRWQGDDPPSTHSHSSDGIGEGLVSLFFIIDSLYDSSEGSVTVIDEPELSLHPQFQRRLRALISDLSRTRQIVYATHSPYFISWSDIENGATIARVFKTPTGTHVAQPPPETLRRVSRLAHDLNNPHVLGLDAAEVFFLDDQVILVEGQEDVVRLPGITAELGIELEGSMFGWGVGGADKMGAIASLLRDMKYQSVSGILDNDKTERRDKLAQEFPEYQFQCIPADDIRPKEERTSPAKRGLTGENGQVRPEHLDETRNIFNRVNEYFRGSKAKLQTETL